jgi:putative colanic acid biosynthesis UDP-glucose lipid carrier transferase
MINLLQTNSSYYKVREPATGASTYTVTKRASDIVVSLLVAVFILSWLIPLIGLLIRLESRGPILFVQLRNGRHGQPFPCLKFRTMVYQREETFKQAARYDPRITRIGRILRKTNLDEMPQFLNVIVGHMSIVGPRPHAIQHDAQFFHLIQDFPKRYTTKPGITGLAQTRGLRGETGLLEMTHRVKLDLWYIKKNSFLLDVKICWWTVEKMIKGDEKAV